MDNAPEGGISLRRPGALRPRDIFLLHRPETTALIIWDAASIQSILVFGEVGFCISAVVVEVE